MDSNQLLQDLRDALKGVTEKGQNSIQVDALNKYLDDWGNTASEQKKISETERSRRLEEWKAQLTVSSAASLEMFKAVIEAGLTALKSSIVINGGAAATLLALLAEGLKANGGGNWGPLLSPLGWAWLCFMTGLGLAGSATAFRYLSQDIYAEAQRRGEGPDNVKKFFGLGNAFKYLAIASGLSSFILFFIGSGIIATVIFTAGKQ